MHQMFKHENRFAQIYDLTEKSSAIVSPSENIEFGERLSENEPSVNTGSIILQQSETNLGEEKIFDLYS